jgi:hypothetical protein
VRQSGNYALTIDRIHSRKSTQPADENAPAFRRWRASLAQIGLKTVANATIVLPAFFRLFRSQRLSQNL